MALIEFENKPSTNTPINATNLNTLQDNVEDAIDEVQKNLNLSKQQDIITDSSDSKCGYKIDSKDVYVKRITYGSLPNKTFKDVSYNISNLHEIVKIEGTALTNTGYGYSIPNNNMLVFYTNEYVRITTTTNESDYNAKLFIYYTKN